MRAVGSETHAPRHRLVSDAAAARAAQAAPYRIREQAWPEWRERFVVMAGPVAEAGSQCPNPGVTAA
jgi:hypothetical protein